MTISRPFSVAKDDVSYIGMRESDTTALTLLTLQCGSPKLFRIALWVNLIELNCRHPGQLSIKLVNSNRRVSAVSFHWPTFIVFIKCDKHL